MKTKSFTMGPFHLSLVGYTEEYGRRKTFLLLRGQPLILAAYLSGLLERARPNAKREAGISDMADLHGHKERENASFGQILFSELVDGEIGDVRKFLHSRLQDIHKKWQEEGCLMGFNATLVDPFKK